MEAAIGALSTTLKNERGSFYLEIMIGTLIFFFAMVALLGLFAGGAQLMASGRIDVVALQIANELLEQVRLTKYENIGLTDATGNEPSGIFLREENTTTADGALYNIRRDIAKVDDPGDGTSTSTPADATPEDYKRVVINVRRPGRAWVKLASDVKLMTLAAMQPTVEFKEPSPDAGSTKVIGGPNSGYSDASLTPLLQVPITVDAWDASSTSSGLTTIGFYINGAILDVVSGPLAGRRASIIFNPTVTTWTDWSNGETSQTVYWNPFYELSGRVYPDRTYEISVQVWNIAGGRDQRSITYILDKDAPYWPDGSWITAEPWQDPSTIKLTWSPALDSIDDTSVYSTTYKIYRDGSYQQTVQGTARVAYDTGLGQWTTHSYKIVAVSPGGRTSPEFNGGSPTATTWINLSVTKAKVSGKWRTTLSWTKPQGVSVDKYQVFRGVNGGALSLYADNISGGSASYIDNPGGGLDDGTYTYRLIAVLSGGGTNRSQDVSITIP